MTKHLVMGGGGFLGRHLARALAARGDQVVVVDVAATTSFDNLVQSYVLDMSNAQAADYDKLVEDMDVVHHCAWSTIPESANKDPASDLRVNLGMTLGVLDALKRRGGGRIVFCSSGGTVYGPLTKTPVSEDHPLDPITAYGVSKLAAEKYLQLYRTLHGVDARIARIANPYGAGQNPKKPQGVVGTVVRRALARQVIEVWGDGSLVRDFIHIGDVVAALLALCDFAAEPQAPIPLFNFGSGVGCTVNTVLAHVESAVGEPLKILRLPGRAFDVPASILDIQRAKRVLDWAPRIKLVEGIAQMATDLREDRERLFSSL